MRYVLGSYVPLFIAELNVRNLTALTWQVHDFTVEVLALEQSFATAIAGRRPPTIRPRTDGALLAQCYLNEFQVRRLKERAQTATTMPTTLYIHAQLESKLGIVEFNPSINNMPAQIMR